MGSTIEYINMCQKAVEVQELWEPQEGDWYISKTLLFCMQWSLVIDFVNDKTGIIWLPRQDQVQKILDMTDPHIITTRIDLWWKQDHIFTGFCGSMEQLWLAFVMQEKYNKTWDGRDWVVP